MGWVSEDLEPACLLGLNLDGTHTDTQTHRHTHTDTQTHRHTDSEFSGP